MATIHFAGIYNLVREGIPMVSKKNLKQPYNK